MRGEGITRRFGGGGGRSFGRGTIAGAGLGTLAVIVVALMPIASAAPPMSFFPPWTYAYTVTPPCQTWGFAQCGGGAGPISAGAGTWTGWSSGQAGPTPGHSWSEVDGIFAQDVDLNGLGLIGVSTMLPYISVNGAVNVQAICSSEHSVAYASAYLNLTVNEWRELNGGGGGWAYGGVSNNPVVWTNIGTWAVSCAYPGGNNIISQLVVYGGAIGGNQGLGNTIPSCQNIFYSNCTIEIGFQIVTTTLVPGGGGSNPNNPGQAAACLDLMGTPPTSCGGGGPNFGVSLYQLDTD